VVTVGIDRAIDHIGIVVRDIRAAVRLAAALGLEADQPKVLEDRGIQVVKVRAPNATLEFMAPLREDSEISKFLEKRGEGLHHICFTAQDLDKAIAGFEDNGIHPIPGTRRKGAEGRDVVFFHPKDTGGILLELEADDGGEHED
jgi:methylmalonyl-CoA/ethylmalonyl-CoA epimerase